MKQQAYNHPKAFHLAEKLGIEHSWAFGLWNGVIFYASDYAQDGSIGKCPEFHIKRFIGWTFNQPLFKTLAEVGILDYDETTDCYYIHDWPDHCEERVRKSLIRADKKFADYYQSPVRKANASSKPPTAAATEDSRSAESEETVGQVEEKKVSNPDSVDQETKTVGQETKTVKQDGQAQKILSDDVGQRPPTLPNHTLPNHTLPNHTLPNHTLPNHTLPDPTPPNPSLPNRKKEEPKANAPPDSPEKYSLEAWISWWNVLHADQLVKFQIEEPMKDKLPAVYEPLLDLPSDDPLAKALANQQLLTEAIRKSPFCKPWLTLEKLLGGKNEEGKWFAVQLIQGAYIDHKNGKSGRGSKSNQPKSKKRKWEPGDPKPVTL